MQLCRKCSVFHHTIYLTATVGRCGHNLRELHQWPCREILYLVCVHFDLLVAGDANQVSAARRFVQRSGEKEKPPCVAKPLREFRLTATLASARRSAVSLIYRRPCRAKIVEIEADARHCQRLGDELFAFAAKVLNTVFAANLLIT